MNIIFKCLNMFIFIILVVMGFTLPAFATDNFCGPITPADDQCFGLRQENDLLIKKFKQFDAINYITVEHLRKKKTLRLREIAADVKAQRQSMSDFESFVKWMSANLAGYNRYIQAGSYAAVIARMLPIPYAGQASIFTKFVAQFTIELNAASMSITNYLNTSQKFLTMADSIDLHNTNDEKIVSDISLYADNKLLKDMNEAEKKLATVSDLSLGALSFLNSLNHYACETDEYWNKVKGVFKKDIDPKEKSYITISTNTLQSQAIRFNDKLKTFEELGNKETVNVKALAVYDELFSEMQTFSLK